MHKRENSGKKYFSAGNQDQLKAGKAQSKAHFFDNQASDRVMPKRIMVTFDPRNPRGSEAAWDKFRKSYMISAMQLAKLRKEKTLANPQAWSSIPFDNDFYLLVKNEIQSLLSDSFGNREFLTLRETRFITHQLLRLEPLAGKLRNTYDETLKNMPNSVPGEFNEFKRILVSQIASPLNAIFQESGFYLTHDSVEGKNKRFRIALFKTPKVFQLPPTYFTILMEGGSENILHNTAVKEKKGAFHQPLESNVLVFGGAGFENTERVQFKINHEIHHHVISAFTFLTGIEVNEVEHEYASYLAALMHSTPEYAEAKFMEWTAVDGCIEPTSVHGHAIRLIIKGIKRLAPGNNYEILDAARARLDIFHAERFGKSQKEGNWKTFTDFEKFCIENLA